MLKLTKTGIGLLMKQYRSVLRKCLLLNLGLLSIPTFAYADIVNEIVVYDRQGDAAAQLESDINSGGLILYGAANEIARLIVHNGYGDLQLGGSGGGSRLTSSYFKLNNSSAATGIDFAANVTGGTTNASHLATTGAVNQLLNYYYTKTEADERYAKLSGNNAFNGRQDFYLGGNRTVSIWGYDGSGEISVYNKNNSNPAILINGMGNSIDIYGTSSVLKTSLSDSSFTLNGSSKATGIDFATNVTAGTTNASHLATTGAVNQLLNYYYTFRVDETEEVIEFTKELETSFSVILRSAEHDVRISAQSAARIDTGLKSGDRHVASLLTMTNQGVNVLEDSLTFSTKTRDGSLGLMEVCHA